MPDARACRPTPMPTAAAAEPWRLPQHRWACLLAAGAAACTPALNWRDVRPDDSGGLQLQFPCRPFEQQRSLPLAGPPLTMRLLACSADGLTFGLAQVDVGDPARVAASLTELRRAAVRNVGAVDGDAGGAQSGSAAGAALRVPGATPNAGSGRFRVVGRLPDGQPTQMQVALFARGTRVYQATVVGHAVGDGAADSFFASMRLAP